MSAVAVEDQYPKAGIKELMEKARSAHEQLIQAAQKFNEVIDEAEKQLAVPVPVLMQCRNCGVDFIEHRSPLVPCHGYHTTACFLAARSRGNS